MEKIYMENNDDNNKRKKSKFMQVMQSKVSNTMAILLILVVFASFLAMSFNQTSYAATSGDQLGDEFESIVQQNDDYRLIYTTNYEPTAYSVPYMHANNTETTQIFCLEKNGAIPTDQVVTYTKSSEITDLGLLYVLANTYPNKNIDISGANPNDDGYKYAQTWITQTAIWLYLNEIGDPGNSTMVQYASTYTTTSSLTVQQFTSESIPEEGPYDFGSSLYGNYVRNLVNTAKEYHNSSASSVSLDVTAPSGNVSITEDEKYYKTGNFNITASTLFGEVSSHTIKLSNAPEGTLIYDSQGNEITPETATSVTEFYLLVPINKVAENNKRLSVTVDTNFATVQAYEYTPNISSYQKVTALASKTETKSDGAEMEIVFTPDSPDTGMSVTQSAYFIGLVILLCGIGIIYANARPRESK